MSSSEDGGSVVAAVLGNLFVAIIKLAAFSISGSGAMLAEGIHSVADTLNQALLWFGIQRSNRPADDSHPYGYGAERYFWALISAMGIFVLGCGVTVYHGVEQVLHPHMPHIGWLTWTVLGVAAVIEGSVLIKAIREAQRKKGDKSWLYFLRYSNDPTLLAVLFEDAIAVTGIGIAALGLGLCLWTGFPVFDGIASIIIGVMLGVLALVLAIKNKTLLIGRSASPEIEQRIRRIVASDPAIAKVLQLKTRVLAAGDHLVDLQVDFDADSVINRLTDEILAAREEVKTDEGLMTFAHRFGAKLIDELAVEVDRLEDAIRKEVPSVSIIDVEGD